MRLALMLILMAASAFTNGLADRRKLMTQRGLYFVARQTTCDASYLCLHPLYNPTYPQSLHWMICPGVKRGH